MFKLYLIIIQGFFCCCFLTNSIGVVFSCNSPTNRWGKFRYMLLTCQKSNDATADQQMSILAAPTPSVLTACCSTSVIHRSACMFITVC